MCAPNKTKKGYKAFSYLFRTHLSITISAMVSGRLGAMPDMSAKNVGDVFLRHSVYMLQQAEQHGI